MDSKKNVKFLLLSLILFISLFSIVVGQTDTKSLCDYKKVGVVGASNTVLGSHRKSWVVFLDEKCPQTKFIVNAEVGAGPTEQLSLLQNLIASNTDLEMIILNPSDNEINGDINSYITTVKEMAELAKGKEGKRKVVVLTNTPSKGYPKWNGIWNKVYENKMNFNKELLESHLGSSNIDVAIDIYSSVGSTSDPDTCGYCASSDHIHLEISGMEKVANAILNKLGVTAATNKGTSPALTLVSLGTPQQPACTQTKVAKTNIPGCQDSQRCKEIDEVWSQKIGPITSNNLQVWDPQTNSWNGFDNVYYTIQQVCGPAQTVSSGTAVSIGKEELCIASVGTAEQRALLDTIAWAEGTYAFAVKYSVSSYQIMIGGTPFYNMAAHPYETGEMTKDHVNKHGSSAAGRYQFLFDTYNANKQRYFATGFGPIQQDTATLALSGISSNQLQQAINSGNFIPIWDKIAPNWASIPYSKTPPENIITKYCTNKNKPGTDCGNGRSYYGQGGVSNSTLKNTFLTCLQQHKSSPGVSTPSIATPSSTTPSSKPATTPSKLPDEVKADESCPAGMVKITNFCIDQYEGSLIDKSTTVAWSPYNLPRNNIGNLKAVSVANVVPQGYISGIQAAQACKNSGKNLCTQTQWLRACQGSDGRKFPYVEEEDKTKCNYGKPHPDVRTAETIQNQITTKYTTMTDPGINREYDLAPTGQYSNCVTPEGVYDLVGNLQEWVDDGDLTNPGSLFGGGYYGATLTQLKIDGGCGFQKTSHSGNQNDYSLGFRCCVSLKN